MAAEPGSPSSHAPPGVSAPDELLRRLAGRGAPSTRYRVDGVVARGGMGVVLSVWDEDLSRTLAMKQLRGSGAGSAAARARARFLEEAQLTGQLAHPSIPAVHELGVDREGHAYFTMPLVRGRDLSEIIGLVRRGAEGWTLARALGVVLKVCEALAYAHSRGVLHRDIKPANVRVGRFGETYLMDWGLARVLGTPDLHDLRLSSDGEPLSGDVSTVRTTLKAETPNSPLVTMDGDVVGTPSYMAPEQAAGRIEELSPRSDVYALGAMLYHLLAGHEPYAPPLGGGDARTVLRRVLAGPPTPLAELAPDAPADLVAICERAMARDPAQRYGDARALAADVEAFLDRRPVRAQRTTLRHALWLAAQRHRGVAWTSAAALLALVVAGVLFVVGLDRSARRERAARREAELALDAYRQRGDVMAARFLVEREPELYPATPAAVPAMENWLERVDDLLSRRNAMAERLDASTPGTAQAEELTGGVQRLAKLEELRPRVLQRLAFARDLARRTVDDERAAWSAAIAAIAEHEAFGGLVLSPQVGLVPLRAHPDSGLWEFWHYASGDRPRAESTGGPWRTGAETGIVLVLLPGGAFVRGSPESEPGRDPEREARRDVLLAPFFLAECEVTQAQWRRTMELDPSRFKFEREGRDLPHHAGALVPTCPVEGVTWEEAHAFAWRLDLALPTEAQWEYAARAGSRSVYGFGDDAGSLEGRANVLDADGEEFGGGQRPAPWSDGYTFTAPVDAFQANPFGVHGMYGNVMEWCADDFSVEVADATDAAGDGLAASRDPDYKSLRGGDWYTPPERSRCARRQWQNRSTRGEVLGLRVARSVR